MSINSIILETAVKNFIPHIEHHDLKNVNWKELSEVNLLEELVLCLLSSSVKYEVAVSYIGYFTEAGFFKSWILNVPNQNELYSILNTPILVNRGMLDIDFLNKKVFSSIV